MIPGKVSCLMATAGRHACVRRALACFLAQDYPRRELVILNNHSVPFLYRHPLVRVVNEPGHPTLGHCRQRLLDFVDGEFCRTWDDDDGYLPHCISQGVEHIGDRPAWKPARSWWANGPDKYDLAGNAMEASILFRTEAVKAVGYQLSMGDEHATLLAKIPVAETELGHWASYLYTWNFGNFHTSGSIGNGQSVEERTRVWRERNQDVRPGQPLVPAFAEVHSWWRRMAPFVPEPDRARWLEMALALPEDCR